MKFYVASCVTVSGVVDPGVVHQNIFKTEEAAKTFVEHSLSLSGWYVDLEWREFSFGLVYQFEIARNNGRYDYGQVNVFDADSLSNPDIVLGGI